MFSTLQNQPSHRPFFLHPTRRPEWVPSENADARVRLCQCVLAAMKPYAQGRSVPGGVAAALRH